MKKTALFCLFALIVTGVLFAQTTGKITVAPPAAQNLDGDDKWIPLFVQGQLTADIQNYSDYTVIDRTAAEQLIGEQRVMETAAAITDDSVNIQYASIVSSDYTVVLSILKKGSGFALDAKILDVKTSQPVGKAYSNANVSAASINDGSVIHQVAYALLSGVGISEKRLSGLRQNTVRTADVAAQTAVAKGIVAEQNGSNIEALTYYLAAKRNNKNLGEATSRLNNMSAAVASGNFGANAKNLIKLREEWDKLLLEAAELIASNPPEFRMMYFSDIEPAELTEENYKNKTMSFKVGAPYLKQTTNGGDNEQLAYSLLEALYKIPESKNWGSKINGFPWTYCEDIKGDNWLKKAVGTEKYYDDETWTTKERYRINGIPLLNEAAEEAERRVRYERNWNSNLEVTFEDVFVEMLFSTSDRWGLVYDDSATPEKYTFTVSLLDANKKIIARKPIEFTVYYCRRYNGHYVKTSNYKRDYNYVPDPEFTFENVSVDNADTDTLYISVEQTSGTKVSILPVPDGVLSYKAVAEKKYQTNQGILRVGGYIGSVLNFKNIMPGHWLLDLSEAMLWKFDGAVTGYIIDRNLGKCPLLLPDTLVSAKLYSGGLGYENDTLWSGCLSFFCGTKLQWHKVVLNYSETRIKSIGAQSTRCDCDPNAVIRAVTPSMEVPNGTGVITKDDFAGYESLKTITIPASVVEVQADAFADCQKLKTVQFEGTKEQWKAIMIAEHGNKKLIKAKVKYGYKAK